MLAQRVLTVVVLLVPLLVVEFLLPRPYAVLLLGALVLAGAWEWAQFYGGRAALERLTYVAAVSLSMGVLWWAVHTGALGLYSVLWLSVAWWVVALAWIVAFPTAIPRWVIVAVGLIVLAPAWLAASRLHLVAERGPELLVFMFVVIWAADTGAYFAGRTFGRVKLAPKVSPGKTWEGVLGGLAVSMMVALAGAAWFDLPVMPLAGLCLAVALVSIVGDLTVSMFKRHAGVKDSGTLFPGHGGVMDRIDSITAGAPVFVLGISWLGVRL